MTIKKFLAPLGAVALVAVMSISLLSHQQRAEGAAVTLFSLKAPVQAVGLVETWTATFTSDDAGSLAAAGTVTVTFPAGFTVPAAPTCTLGANFAATPVATCVGTGQVVVATIVTGTLAVSTVGTVLIAGITNPTAATVFAAGSTAGTIATSSSTTAANGAAITIWNVTAAKVPTLAGSADGASTSQITFTASNAANLTNLGSSTSTLTVTTDVGHFANAPTATAMGTWAAITVGATTSTATMTANMALNSVSIVTVRAPVAAGTSTVILRATPANGGTAVILGSMQITWNAASVAGAVASGSVTPTAAVTIAATAGTQVLTYTFLDANAIAPIPGAAVVCSSTLGTLAAPTNGTGAGTQQVTGTIPVGGVYAVTLTGSGLGGTSTVTCVVGSVSVAKTASLTGIASTITITLARANTTSLTAKGTIRNTDSQTTDQDELLAIAIVKDANGNVLGSGNVAWTLTTPTGSTLVFQNATGYTTATVTSEGTAGVGSNLAPSANIAGANGLLATTAVTAGAGGTAVAAGVVYIDSDSVAGEPVGTYTLTATYTNADTTYATTRATFTAVKAPATLTVPTGIGVAVGGTQVIEITCKDGDGNACPSGTLITATVTGYSLLLQNAVTGSTGLSTGDIRTADNGTAKLTLIGVIAGTGQMVVNTSSVTALTSITVGATASAGTVAPAAGTVVATPTFTGTISTGISIVTFTGTSTQLGAALTTSKAVSATVYVAGKPVTYVAGAPEFVNSAFTAVYPTGLSATAVIVVVN